MEEGLSLARNLLPDAVGRLCDSAEDGRDRMGFSLVFLRLGWAEEDLEWRDCATEPTRLAISSRSTSEDGATPEMGDS